MYNIESTHHQAICLFSVNTRTSATMWLSLGAHDSKPAAQISEENHKLECVLTLVWPDCLGGG